MSSRKALVGARRTTDGPPLGSRSRAIAAFERRRDAAMARHAAAVDAWEYHLVRCSDCLAQGRWFCPEGTYLARTAVDRRETAAALRVPAARTSDRPPFLARLRSARRGPEAEPGPWTASPSSGRA